MREVCERKRETQRDGLSERKTERENREARETENE